LKAQTHSDQKRKNKYLKPEYIISLIAVLTILFTPLYNKISKQYVDSSLKNAAISYAIARSINAGVSIIKNSSVTLGVGMEGTIALGEVLDPVNDAVERFSDVLTLSVWSLGIEKIIYEISKLPLFTALIIILALLHIFYPSVFTKNLLTAFIIVRLFLPFSSLISTYLNNTYFTPQITKINKILKPTAKEIKINTSQKSGFWNKVSSTINETKNSLNVLKENTKYYIHNAATIVKNLLILASVYLTQLLINILLLPLLLIYLLKNVKSE